MRSFLCNKETYRIIATVIVIFSLVFIDVHYFHSILTRSISVVFSLLIVVILVLCMCCIAPTMIRIIVERENKRWIQLSAQERIMKKHITRHRAIRMLGRIDGYKLIETP